MRLYRTGTEKPAGGGQNASLSSAYAQNLEFVCMFPDGDSRRDSTGNYFPSSVPLAPVWFSDIQATPWGKGIRILGDNHSEAYRLRAATGPSESAATLLGGLLTIITRINYDTASQTAGFLGPALASCAANGTPAAGEGWALRHDIGTAWRLHNNGTSINLTDTVPMSGWTTLGIVVDFGDPSGTPRMASYRDGTLFNQQFQTRTWSNPVGTNPLECFGMSNAVDLQMVLLVDYIMMWTRALDHGEVAEISANPMIVMEKDVQWLPLLPATNVIVQQATVQILAQGPAVAVETGVAVGQAQVTILAEGPAVTADSNIQVGQATITITGLGPTVNIGTEVVVGQASVTITPNTVEVGAEIGIDVGQAIVLITTLPVGVTQPGAATNVNVGQNIITITASSVSVSVVAGDCPWPEATKDSIEWNESTGVLNSWDEDTCGDPDWTEEGGKTC